VPRAAACRRRRCLLQQAPADQAPQHSAQRHVWCDAAVWCSRPHATVPGAADLTVIWAVLFEGLWEGGLVDAYPGRLNAPAQHFSTSGMRNEASQVKRGAFWCAGCLFP
jgi:hypothetical protein